MIGKGTDIRERNYGYLPVSIIDKPLSERIASTIRHNVARGVHTIDGTARIIYMLDSLNWNLEDFEKKLGLSKEMIAKYKIISGLSKIFEKRNEYSKAWIPAKAIQKGKIYMPKEEK